MVINEIDHAGADVQTFLHALLDDKEFAGFNLPDDEGTYVKPMDNFQCIATMNGYPEDLQEPLADRFPVKLNIDKIHPVALESLGNKLKSVYLDNSQAISVRKWIELKKLMDSDMPNELAVRILFDDEEDQYAVLTALGYQDE